MDNRIITAALWVVLSIIPFQGAAWAGFDEAAAAQPTSESATAWGNRWELEEQARRGRYALIPYKPSYILPITYNSSPDSEPYKFFDPNAEVNEIEAKYQISFKFKVLEDLFGSGGDLWATYTQLSLWQVYNQEFSAPFRETNYEPEIGLTFGTDYKFLGLHGRLWGIGFNHQSNGRAEPLSRSWNRIVGMALFERGNYALWARAWYRIPEDSADDNNPDVEKYVGSGELLSAYKWRQYTFALNVRNNFQFNKNRGSVQLDWSFPLVGPMKGYVQYFNGYGETLIDYNHTTNRIGLGIMATDWL